MSSWPIRRKLAAIVAPPLTIILAAGALVAVGGFNSVQDARQAQRLAQLIQVSGQANLALGREVDTAVVGAAIGVAENGTKASPNSLSRLSALIDVTDEVRARLLAILDDPPPDGWSPEVVQARRDIEARVADLAKARAVARTSRSYTITNDSYQGVLTKQIALTTALARDLSVATTDDRLSTAARTITALSSLATSATLERLEGGLLLAKAPVGSDDRISSTQLSAYVTYVQAQQIQADVARQFGTPKARTLLEGALAEDDTRMRAYRRQVGDLITGIPRDSIRRAGSAAEFSEAAGQRLQRIDLVVNGVAEETTAIAGDVERTALLRLVAVTGIALATLVVGVLLSTAVARTVTVPLRRLRSAAVEAATVRLPAAVRQIERQGPDAVLALPPVLPPGTAAGPETLEVASAVDGLTSEALRLATAQVRLRQAIDEAFVSMSRRSQSMVEKQLSIIDELESTEEDPDQLRNLFRLDHLAARMRRYNDNLLVLAGSTVRTRSAAPVPIADVFRAATSEMEQYERVRLQPISGTAIAGPAAGGLIHLLAELLDNAAMYSPPTSPILLTAQLMPDGGLHLEVTDSGVGIPPTEIAELNARLNTPGTLDAQVPSRMGLFVVARLAQRGGLRIRLSPRANTAGTVAEVIVPPGLVAGGSTGDNQPSAFGGIPAGPAGPAGPGVVGPAGKNGFGSLDPAAPQSPTPVAPSRPVPASAPAEPARSAPLVPTATAAAGITPMPGRTLQDPGPNGTAAPKVAAGTSPLPSRRPGAVLSGGPLAAVAAQPRPAAPAPPTPPPGSAGLFGVAAATSGNPFEPAPKNADTAAAPAGQRTDSDPDTDTDGPRLPLRGATAAWSTRPDAKALPTRNRGASGPPTFGRAAEGSTSRPAADSPTAVPPGPMFGLPVAAAGTAAQDTVPADTLGELPRRQRGASAPPAPPAVPSAAPLVAPSAAPPVAPAAAPVEPAAAPPVEPAAAPPVEPAAAPPVEPAAAPPVEPAAAPPVAPSATPQDEQPAWYERTGPPFTPAPALPITPLESKAAPIQEVTQTGPSMGEGTSLTGEVPLRGRSTDAIPPVKQSAAPMPPVAVPGARTDGHGSASSGGAPSAWDPALPTELAARAATDTDSRRYRPVNQNAPMIGNGSPPPPTAPTPIFDSISVWFSTDASAPSTGSLDEVEHVVDLRDGPRKPVTASASSHRWASLGDQQWLAASARAAASPEISGTTGTGLPVRRPGANLVPSAPGVVPASVAAADGGPAKPVTAPPTPVHRADPDAVRGRLGSYQRGLTSARRSRRAPGDGDPLFAGTQDGNGTHKTPEGTGGDT